MSSEEDEVKQLIKSLLNSTALVSTIRDVQKDYHGLMGSNIPYSKLGYNSLEHFLKSIPDVCTVKGSGAYAEVHVVVNDKSKHIAELVTKQKVNVKPGRFRPAVRKRIIQPNTSHHNRNTFTPRTQNYSLTPHNSSTSSISSQISTESVRGYYGLPSEKDRFLGSKPHNNHHLSSSSSNITSTPINRSQKATYNREQNNIGTHSDHEQIDILKKSQTDANKNETSALGFVTNLEAPPPLNNVNSVEKYFKRRLNLMKPTNEEVLNNSYLTNSIVKVPFPMDNIEEDLSNVPRKVQENLKKLIAQYEHGIWSSDLPAIYLGMFRRELIFKEYGYSSLIELCISLKHIFHYVRPGGDDFKLYDKTKPLPQTVEKQFTMASFNVEKPTTLSEALPELDWADFKRIIPDDVFQYGQEISRRFLPATTNIDDVLDVVVVEVYDPSKFWITLGGADESELNELMDEIQQFYCDEENAKAYAVPPGLLKEGLYCVQVIYNEYHRARILRVFPDDTIRVFFMDYGTVCKVSAKGVCFLLKKFGEVPAQAIRCRLANVVPKEAEHPWPQSASTRLRELVNRRDTKIKVSFINWNEEYVCVFLADTTDPQNVKYINETMVKEGHALFENQAQIRPFVLPNALCVVQKVHMFPTFDELENGVVPNSTEMLKFEELNVPLQFCLPMYFRNQVSNDLDAKIEAQEKCFIETVKNHRKFNTFIKPSNHDAVLALDFDIFGALKDNIIEFCKETGAAVPLPISSNDDNHSSDDRERLELLKQDKELAQSIIQKLEKFSLLESESSVTPEEDVQPNKDEALDDVCTYYSLSTITELSENELDTSSEKKPGRNPFFKMFACNDEINEETDINIFDNPEAFEDEDTESSSSRKSPGTPLEFFTNLQSRISEKDFCEPAGNDFAEAKAVSKNPFMNIEEEHRDNESTYEETSSNTITEEPLTQQFRSTNPFLHYLDEFNVKGITASSSKSDVSASIEPQESALTASVSSISLKEATCSDSDSSSYNEFVPRNHVSQATSVDTRCSSSPFSNKASPRPSLTPRSTYDMTSQLSVNTVPATPYSFNPAFRQPYPPWSQGTGFPPIPQYPQWSNGPGYPTACPPQRPFVRPPPGFAPHPYQGPPIMYQCPPQQPPQYFRPPTYPQYYQMQRPQCPEMPPPYGYGYPPLQRPTGGALNNGSQDFYDRFNEQILKGEQSNAS